VVRRIFDVTLTELASAGLAGLSVPEVARKAGVNKTSVYRRWPTKEELVKAALESSLEHTRDLPDSGSFEADLSELLARVVEFVSSPRGSALLQTLFLDSHDRSLSSLAKEAWAEAAGEAPQLIVKRAIERGELAPTADVEMLLFTAAGAVLHRVFVERGPADAAWTRRLISLLLEGVSANPRKVSGRRRASRPSPGR
jgi:AcrR family transcriptional regulator